MEHNVLDFFNKDVRIKAAKDKFTKFINELVENGIGLEEIDDIFEEAMIEIEGFDFEEGDSA